VTGYDLLSGWGSPNGSGLINLLAPVAGGTTPQTITFTTSAPSSAAYNSQFTVAATASSGLAVTFTSSGSCSNSGATYTMTAGSGTCSVIANQSGNTTYAVAPTVTQTTNATLATQTITFTTSAPASAAYGTHFTVAATGGASGNSLVFTKRWIVQQFWRDLHDDERRGNVFGDCESGGQCELLRGSAGHTDHERDSGQSDYNVHDERTGQRSLRH